MVEKFIARLRITPEEAAMYNPSPGMNVAWLEFNRSKGEAVGSWSSSMMQPDPLLRKSAKDLQHEVATVFKSRMLEHNLQYHHLQPQRSMILETDLDHPDITQQPNLPREIKRAVEAAIDVHEVELTTEEVRNMPRLNPKHKIEPIETRQKMRKVNQMQRDGTVKTVDEVEHDVHVFRVGTIDSS